MKNFFCFLLLICCSVSVGKGLHFAKKGFTFRRIRAPTMKQKVGWNMALNPVIGQPFRLIGRGSQCFAFASLDDQYILKLPRTDIYQVPFWMRAFPFLNKKKELFEKRQKIREEQLLESFRIATEELFVETGVVASHLGQSEVSEKKIILIDSLGSTYPILAYKTTYILQHKQSLLVEEFMRALKKREIEQAHKILDAFIEVVVSRGKKGIWNKDGSFVSNFGFDGEKGYQIDIGSFYKKENAVASIYTTMEPVRAWLKKKAPSMLPYFDKNLEKALYQLSSD